MLADSVSRIIIFYHITVVLSRICLQGEIKKYKGKIQMKSISYFVLPNEAIELYASRTISAVDLTVYCYLHSLRREYDGVCVSRKQIAAACGLCENTATAAVNRLYNCGLILDIIIEETKEIKKYKTAVYRLKPLPSSNSGSGFCFVPRGIFTYRGISPKMFAVFFFMCMAQHLGYGKSWNSYNNIRERLGFCENQLSEVKRLVNALAEVGVVAKTVRKIKQVFIKNIYRVRGFASFDTGTKTKKKAKENRSAANRARFKTIANKKTSISKSKVIIPRFFYNVKPFQQLFFSPWGVGCEFAYNILTKKVGGKNPAYSAVRQKKRNE